jgi:hypothetical protein
MKDQCSTGGTVYRTAAGKKITEAEYKRLQSGAEDPAGKDEVKGDDYSQNSGSSKG